MRALVVAIVRAIHEAAVAANIDGKFFQNQMKRVPAAGVIAAMGDGRKSVLVKCLKLLVIKRKVSDMTETDCEHILNFDSWVFELLAFGYVTA